MKLTAYPNVTSLAEERRLRGRRHLEAMSDEEFSRHMMAGMVFPNFRAQEPEAAPPRSNPAAQALLAGILQGVGEREKDEALLDAGKRLGDAAQKGQQASPEGRQRPGWLRAILGLVRQMTRRGG
jgi:hypothetical protein